MGLVLIDVVVCLFACLPSCGLRNWQPVDVYKLAAQAIARRPTNEQRSSSGSFFRPELTGRQCRQATGLRQLARCRCLSIRGGSRCIAEMAHGATIRLPSSIKLDFASNKCSRCSGRLREFAENKTTGRRNETAALLFASRSSAAG